MCSAKPRALDLGASGHLKRRQVDSAILCCIESLTLARGVSNLAHAAPRAPGHGQATDVDNALHNGCNRRTNSDARLAVISSRSVARVIAT